LVEDDYLSRHSLVDGVKDFLINAKLKNIPVWCLSNDVGQWSKKLRDLFQIENLLAGAIISSEVRAGKPDRAIYQCLLDRIGRRADELLFVDDREKNVEGAIAAGIPSILFFQESGYRNPTKRVLGSGGR
jgi:HAD superfamily hydrolase (TIGR01509 family)